MPLNESGQARKDPENTTLFSSTFPAAALADQLPSLEAVQENTDAFFDLLSKEIGVAAECIQFSWVDAEQKFKSECADQRVSVSK